jgi:hypothetical protein
MSRGLAVNPAARLSTAHASVKDRHQVKDRPPGNKPGGLKHREDVYWM